MNKPEYIIVHHTGGTDADPLADTSYHTLEIVDAYHKSLGWNGIGYNWFVEKTGLLRKGRDEKLTGAHTIGYNNKSIGICLAGNFDATFPTTKQIETLKKLLEDKSLEYGITIDKIVPHRKFAKKTCYGVNLSDTWASDLLKNIDIPTIVTPTEEITIEEPIITPNIASNWLYRALQRLLRYFNII
jgi:N-acetylmuramoyl-L-alanine amidase